LDFLLGDLPARAKDLKALSRGQIDLLRTLGHVWSSVRSSRLLKLPNYLRQREAILDALTAAAENCRS
jgi:hypothetical protein